MCYECVFYNVVTICHKVLSTNKLKYFTFLTENFHFVINAMFNNIYVHQCTVTSVVKELV